MYFVFRLEVMVDFAALKVRELPICMDLALSEAVISYSAVYCSI